MHPKLPVPCLIHEAARETPGAVALESGEASMTYENLDQRSSNLANVLKQRGVGPEIVVALCLDRSLDYVVSALAVWKAGGAYLPLDPAWPEARRSQIIEDSGSPVLITRSTDLCSPAMTLDPAEVSTATEPATGDGLRLEQLAYVIYTSGSSGKPKGVEITHANLFNLVQWYCQTFSVERTDKGSHLAGLGFDAAVWELWPFLSSGARVVMAPEEIRTSPELVRDWLVAKRINVSFIPTILAEPLITSPWPEHTALRFVLTGGDKLTRYPISGLPFRLVNNYGPTECTVAATSGVVEPSKNSAPPSIGTAISNTQIHLLDKDFRPVQPGVAGEIFIGGSSVGRGYRNHRDLTEERFIPDPFAAVGGTRMYRTGDLGATRPDGQIEFRGRVDFEEKIRGHRIDPDEIAFELSSYPGVSAAIVSGFGESGRRRLVAYIIAAGSVSDDELVGHLQNKLPDYMIPAVFVRLETLPLTSSGKIDRIALPVPEPNVREYVAPASTIERLVACVISKLVQQDSIGRHDGLAELGIDSMLMARLIVQMRDIFCVTLKARDVIKAVTVSGLAAILRDQIVCGIDIITEDQTQQLLKLFEADDLERSRSHPGNSSQGLDPAFVSNQNSCARGSKPFR